MRRAAAPTSRSGTRGWERHGDGAQEYRDGFEQVGAWAYALERFAAAAR